MKKRKGLKKTLKDEQKFKGEIGRDFQMDEVLCVETQGQKQQATGSSQGVS